MKKTVLILGAIVFTLVGCMGVQVKAPEKPFKVDIAMRLDVYQHVQKDIDSIESIVTGTDKAGGTLVQSFLDRVTATAYAQDIDPAIEEAALRRKARYGEIVSLEKQGMLGESGLGLVEIRKNSSASMVKLVNDENSDRMIIYKGIAEKNGTTVEGVQKVYAARLQDDAPSGTPVEIVKRNWQIK
jgi:uncharacterized protein YdbL (DUF1318 family)